MIRLATTKDIKSILTIVEDARSQITKLGFSQWTKESNYPNEDTFMIDISKDSLYVYTKNDLVLGMFVIDKEHNFDYDNIEGNWLSLGKYYTVHRLAVKEETRHLGIGLKMLEFAKNIALKNKVSLRIDTHPKNTPMLNLIKKANFKYCGLIRLKKEKVEPERKAYEMVLV